LLQCTEESGVAGPLAGDGRTTLWLWVYPLSKVHRTAGLSDGYLQRRLPGVGLHHRALSATEAAVAAAGINHRRRVATVYGASVSVGLPASTTRIGPQVRPLLVERRTTRSMSPVSPQEGDLRASAKASRLPTFVLTRAGIRKQP
jgi:hypothetical protein